MTIKNFMFAGMTLIGSLLVFGCTSYYQITDPQTGNVYYSHDINEKGNGAISFKDAKSKNTVTIQNSEVIEVSPDQFEAGTK